MYRNNTYTCIRSLGQEDSLFCEFQDRVNTIEMYNIAQDPLQLTNLAGMLSSETLDHYKVSQLNLLGLIFSSFFRNKYLNSSNAKETDATIYEGMFNSILVLTVIDRVLQCFLRYSHFLISS